MPNLTDITGLVGIAGATAALVLMLPRISRLTRLQVALLTGTVFMLMLVPFGGMPLAAYVRGVTGDLSITTLVLLAIVALRPWCDCNPIGREAGLPLRLLIALAAFFLYPVAFGIGAFDPYGLGYGDPVFVAMLLLAALLAWFPGYPAVALCVALATLAWSVGWYESGNLWDYLLDPFVTIYALTGIMAHAVKALSRRGRSHQSALPE